MGKKGFQPHPMHERKKIKKDSAVAVLGEKKKNTCHSKKKKAVEILDGANNTSVEKL